MATLDERLALARDPRLYRQRTNPPTFKLEDKETFHVWRTASWQGFLNREGITKLRADDADPATQQEKAADLKRILHGALMAALDQPTIALTTTLTIADREDADAIIAALQVHFDGSTNDRVHRKNLLARTRRPNESGEDYAAAIQALAAKVRWAVPADANAVKEEWMAQAIVIGANDSELQQLMLREPATSGFRELSALMCHVLASRTGARTLQSQAAATPETTAWQPKPAQYQRGGYRGGRGRGRGRGGGRGGQRNDQPQQQQQQSTTCGNCGQQRHQSGETCPASGKECHGCRKIGHFREVCRSEGRTHNLEDNGEQEDDGAEASAWTGAVLAPCVVVRLPGTEQPDMLPPLRATKAKVRPTRLRTTRTVKAANIEFLADTGANLTCIDVQLLPMFKMTRADLVGTDPPPRVPAQAGTAKAGLKGVGLFKALIEVGTGSTTADVYVYDGLRRPLLLRQHCEALDIYRAGSNNTEVATLVDED